METTSWNIALVKIERVSGVHISSRITDNNSIADNSKSSYCEVQDVKWSRKSTSENKAMDKSEPA